jgi:hypothetical protein
MNAYQEAVLHEVRRERARRHLVAYGQLIMPKYQRARHTDLLCRTLEALERGDIDSLIVEFPPRHSKTTHVSQLLPSWWLGRHPESQIILASHTASLSERNSRTVRGHLQSPAYPFETRLNPKITAANEWETTAGGRLLAAGVGGPLVGSGADLLVIDDPIKNREEANSPTQRQKIWEWYSEVADTRLQPGGRQVIIMQRWHEDDLVGRVLASENARYFQVLRLPAVAEPTDTEPDPLGRAPGEPLWPEWYPLERLFRLKSNLTGEMGPLAWYGLYQQRPTSAEGHIFHPYDWPEFLEWPERIVSAAVTVDSAFKQSVSNDWSVAQVWAFTAERRWYLLDQRRARVDFGGLKRLVWDLTVEWEAKLNRSLLVAIEDKASGQSLIQELRQGWGDRTGTVYRPLYARSWVELLGRSNAWLKNADKVQRAEAKSHIPQDNRVFLPKGAPWLDEYRAEVAAFDRGKFDDQVDATVMALWLFDTYREQRPRSRPYRVISDAIDESV